MFHSQGSLSKFQIFKSHLVKRTAVPSADRHWALHISPMSSSMMWEMWFLTDMMAAENPKNENVQSF
jgi:hypothetical protein